MTDWSYVAVDTQQGYALADLDLTGVSITLAINAAGSMTATLPLPSTADVAALRDATVPLRTTIYAVADGVPIFGGIVMGRDVDLGAGSVALTIVESLAWWGMWSFPVDTWGDTNNMMWALATLMLPDEMAAWPPLSWVPAHAPLTVMGGVLGWHTQSGYDVSLEGPSDYTIAAEDKQNRTPLDVLATLSQAAHPVGFDFGMEYMLGPGVTPTELRDGRLQVQPYTSRLSVWYPWRGRDTGVMLEWPGDATSGHWVDDASNVATSVTVEGGGLGTQSTQRAEAHNESLTTAGWPWVQRSVRLGQTTGKLTQLARGAADAASTVAAWPTLTVRTDGATPVGSYGVGDMVRVRVSSPWFGAGPAPGIDELWRVQQMVLSPADDTAALTLMSTWSP